jgi:3-oxoacyl-[acyl-carrier-protein] synthase-3
MSHEVSAAPPVALHRPLPSLRSAAITGLGLYVPEKVLTNTDLEKLVDTNDEWIRSRTGIAERRIVADDEWTADLAEKAARAALADAGVSPGEVQLVIVATCTPDFQFPATAALLQHRLGCTAAAFDLEAACSGFVYGLIVAQQFIATGAVDTALVVGAEVMSRILDWKDRNTCVLFGDGAGAAVVQAAPQGYGITGIDLGANGAGGDLLKVEIAPQAVEQAAEAAVGAPPARRVFQNGKEVYRFAVNVMGESAVRAAQNASLDPSQVDLLVPHQANIRIIESAAKRMNLPMDKVFVNVHKYGNTSAASIPIALCEARNEGRLNHDDNVVIVGFGAGLTWAAAAMKWHSPIDD